MRSATLLTPNHPAWSTVEREQRALLRPPADASTEDLLRRGIHLSRQAILLLNAIQRPDDERTPSP